MAVWSHELLRGGEDTRGVQRGDGDAEKHVEAYYCHHHLDARRCARGASHANMIKWTIVIHVYTHVNHHDMYT